MAENVRRDHAGGLVERCRSSRLLAFLCICYISGVWGRVIRRDVARALEKEREGVKQSLERKGR